ncbi:MAG TPA: MXAN_6640 family putative metalloprotease, partial [Actinomycetota bacterium]|nr:MXAN_6640 family putative metalloprotease [Actinomycetota bacterium]
MAATVVTIVTLLGATATAAPATHATLPQENVPTVAPVAHDALYDRLQSGALSEARYALERVRSLFHLSEVRDEYGAVSRPAPTDATLLMRDLALRLDSLSGDDRAAAEDLLARPTQGSNDPDGMGYATNEAAPRCSANVCVHYVTSTTDRTTAAYADKVLAVMDEVWVTEVDSFRWREPQSDSQARPNGGDGRFDVYLANVGAQDIYGYCTVDVGQNTYTRSTYCVLDNDFVEFPSPVEDGALRVTAAHEFNHAIQYAYDVTDDYWLMEATSTWIEDEVYDDVNDNYQYLVTGPLGSPEVPADSFIDFSSFGRDSGYQYGTFVWMRYLSEMFHSRDIVRRIWEEVDARTAGASSLYSLQGIAAALEEQGTGFSSSFADF